MASRSEIAALLASQGGQFSPVKKRGYLLPIGQNQKGKTVPAVPQFVYDIGAALAAPGKVMRNPGLMINPETGRTSDYAINRSADLAGMMTLGSGAIPAQPNSLRMGIKAYHGSPHDFDRFSMDKIGTGEGAQAYGHGLYFAENPQTAKNYRDALEYGIEAGGKKFTPAGDDMVGRTAMDQLTVDNFDVPTTIQNIKNEIETAATREDRKLWEGALKQVQEWASHGEVRNTGRMYEVNIDANPNAFLDWDRPLSEQGPKVRQFLDDYRALGADIPEDSATGAQLYSKTIWNSGKDDSEWAKGIGRAKQYAPNASDALRREGIPGIKYLDAGSRSAGDGSRNYVVFDDKLISIVKKYGVAALVAAGVLDQTQGEELKARGYN